MKVQRTVCINPIEPAPISLRAPAKVPLTVDFQYLDQAGGGISVDVAAQLQVTSRTNGNTDVYAVPAIDITNGKARVSIGKDILTDMNGYRLRLVGTYKGEAMLIGLGTLGITEAAGIEETPEDVIDDVPLTLAYNLDTAISIRLWQDAAKTAPFDLTTATIIAAIYDSRDGVATLASFTVTPTATPGEVVLQMPYTVINTLPATCWWALRASTAGGVTTLCQGTVTITGAPA
jgi:hypothetical protein